MQVVHVINNLPVGGAERFLLQLVSAQIRLGVSAAVVTLVDRNPLAAELEARDIPHTCLNRKRLNDPRLILDLIRTFRLQQPDVVHTHLFYADTFGRLAARATRVPAIVSTEHSTEAGALSRRRLAGIRWTAPLAHRLVAVSEAVRRSMLARGSLGGARICVISNGIELDAWEKAVALPRTELNLGADAFVIGCVGRMVESKGYGHLLEALSRLNDANLRLLMIGDGPHREQLQNRSRDPTLAGRVQWLGARSDVPRILKSLDVFALPSFWEGHSLALLEAMAAGCACLVSDIPELAETVGEAAVRVQPGDADSIAAGLRELMDAPERRRTLADAARRAVGRFSIETAARNYVSLYNELLAASAPAGATVPKGSG